MDYKAYAKYTRKDLIDIIEALQEYAENALTVAKEGEEDGRSPYYIIGATTTGLEIIANKDREHIKEIVDFKRLVRDEF